LEIHNFNSITPNNINNVSTFIRKSKKSISNIHNACITYFLLRYFKIRPCREWEQRTCANTLVCCFQSCRTWTNIFYIWAKNSMWARMPSHSLVVLVYNMTQVFRSDSGDGWIWIYLGGLAGTNKMTHIFARFSCIIKISEQNWSDLCIMGVRNRFLAFFNKYRRIIYIILSSRIKVMNFQSIHY
jgi:hypothetical protein